MKRTIIAALLALATTGALHGQDLPAATESKVGARDVLEVVVLQDEKFNARVTVGEEGIITLPYVGKVPVAGLSPHEIEAKLKTALEARFLRSADVSVQVVQFGSKPISVVGAVARPGTLNVSSGVTLIQALTQAGGLVAGYGKVLYILRTAQNGMTEQLAIDIDDLLVNGNPDLNVPLEPNDLVNVPIEAPINIYLIGEVMHPGKLEMRRAQSPSLLQAIAAAGGPTDRAGRMAIIKRAGSAKGITVNFRRVAEGDAPDVPLQDGDTIYIKTSFF